MKNSICCVVVTTIVVATNSIGGASHQSAPPGAKFSGDRQEQLQIRLRPRYQTRRPNSPGPHPAVLMVSGCSGFADARFPTTYAQRAETLVSAGYVVGYVNYLAAHGVDNACDWAPNADGRPIALREIGEYVVAAAADFRDDPGVQGAPVFAAGWSLGGGGVLTALSVIPENAFPLAGVVAFFPVCRSVPAWSSSIPALLLLGDIDNIQPAEFCRALAKRLTAGTRTTVRSYANAHHGFDISEIPVVTKPEAGPTLGHNPEARAAAWAEMMVFLRR